jgi:spore maturation protein CgeB
MRKSKIVLNTIMVPGSHERVFSAMLNGAVVLSDSNQFYQDFFKDGEDLLLYRWTQIDKLPGIIKEALSSPEKLAQIAAAGQQKAMAEHTWEKRAEMLLGMLKR